MFLNFSSVCQNISACLKLKMAGRGGDNSRLYKIGVPIQGKVFDPVLEKYLEKKYLFWKSEGHTVFH